MCVCVSQDVCVCVSNNEEIQNLLFRQILFLFSFAREQKISNLTSSDLLFPTYQAQILHARI